MPQFPTNKTLDFYQFETVAGKESYEDEPYLENIAAGVYPVDTSILAVLPGESAYQTYDCFIFAKLAIKNGDKAKDVDGVEWIVRGVSYQMDSYLVYTKLLLEMVV